MESIAIARRNLVYKLERNKYDYLGLRFRL
jgi:hypothetical protein